MRSTLSLTLMAAALTSAHAAQAPVSPIVEWYSDNIEGVSTYYGNYGGGGACNLDQGNGVAVPPEIKNIAFTVAMNNQQFKMGSCGMCIELTGDGSGSGSDPVKGTYTVFVNNLCPECKWGHLDFAENGDGLWNIKWKAVPCDVGDHNIRYEFKGSNTWWMKISPQATRYPVKLVEIYYRGAWVTGALSSDQMYVFEATDGVQFTFPMKVRTTSIFGQLVIDTLPALQSHKGTSQFPLVASSSSSSSSSSSPPSSSSSSAPSSSPSTTSASPSSSTSSPPSSPSSSSTSTPPPATTTTTPAGPSVPPSSTTSSSGSTYVPTGPNMPSGSINNLPTDTSSASTINGLNGNSATTGIGADDFGGASGIGSNDVDGGVSTNGIPVTGYSIPTGVTGPAGSAVGVAGASSVNGNVGGVSVSVSAADQDVPRRQQQQQKEKTVKGEEAFGGDQGGRKRKLRKAGHAKRQ